MRLQGATLTEPLYLNVVAPAGTQFSEALPPHHNAFVYVIQGTVNLTGFAGEPRVLQRDDLGILAHGERVSLTAAERTGRARWPLCHEYPRRNTAGHGRLCRWKTLTGAMPDRLT